MTRRQFTITSASAVAMVAMGCDGASGQSDPVAAKSAGATLGATGDRKRHPSKLAKEPFLIGPPSRYATAGLYTDYYDHKGVWIVSDARFLVVLSSTCTHLGCATKLDESAQQFSCPCHKSRFDLDGIHLKGSKAKRPLERCALRLVDGQIEVDPTRRFRKDRSQWSDPACSLVIG